MTQVASRVGDWLRQEPLAQFLTAGLVLFLLYALVAPKELTDTDTISISAAQQQNIAALFERTWGRPPTPQEREGLVAARVREEILSREAVAMGLSDGDAVVRARLAQKLEFLSDDLAATLVPTDQELEAFLAAHEQKYVVGGRTSFQHIFLKPLDDGSLDTQRAAEILQSAKTGADLQSFGDPTLLPPEMTLASRNEITATFGEDFLAALNNVPVNEWYSYLRSPFGYHLVFVEERNSPREPSLEEVRDVLVRDWRDAQRLKLRDAFYEDVRGRYQVEIEQPSNKDEK